MKKIAIFGAPCNNGNLGCMALTYSLISLLEQIAKEHSDDYKYYIFEWEPDENAKNQVENNLNLNKGQISSCPMIRARDPIRYLAHFTLNRKLLSIISDCDIVIDLTNGDGFSDIYGEYGFHLNTNIKLLVENIKKKLILGPQTYGPFKNCRNEKKASKAIQGAACVMARDRISRDEVKRISGKDAFVTTDLAFQLPYTNFERISNNHKIGVNISGLLTANKIENTETNFSISVDYDLLLTKLLKYFCSKKFEIHLIPHVLADVTAIDKYHEKFPTTIVERLPNTPMEVKSVISSMDVFLGSRMHATIAAISSGVFTIPLAYSRKFKGVFDLIEYDHVIDLQKLSTNNAYDKVISLLESSDDLYKDVINSRNICNMYKEKTKQAFEQQLYNIDFMER